MTGGDVNRKLIRKTLLCATMLMGVSTPAFAADAPGDGSDIVVTATRRQTTLQDAPINISAVGANSFAKERIDDVKALAAFTPGLTVNDAGPKSTGTIVMRGISSDSSATGSNYETAVGVYLGEVPLYLDFKLLDISRVEVLQGRRARCMAARWRARCAICPTGPPPTSSRWICTRAALPRRTVQNLAPMSMAPSTFPFWPDHIALRSTVGYYSNPGFINYNHLLKNPGVSDPQPVRGTTAAQGGWHVHRLCEQLHLPQRVNYEHTFTTRNQLLLEASPAAKLYLTYAHQITKTLAARPPARACWAPTNTKARGAIWSPPRARPICSPPNSTSTWALRRWWQPAPTPIRT
jgi:hypothetical protein